MADEQSSHDIHPLGEPPADPSSAGAASTSAPGDGAADDTTEFDGVPDPYAGTVAPADRYEGAVPPGYDWPTHGGYLGCLMGVMVAFIVGGFVGAFAVGMLSVTPLAVVVSSPVARILLIAVIFLAVVIALGRAGWVLGKRFYREYEQPARGQVVVRPLAAPRSSTVQDKPSTESTRL